jgi:hypothetical protein
MESAAFIVAGALVIAFGGALWVAVVLLVIGGLIAAVELLP